MLRKIDYPIQQMHKLFDTIKLAVGVQNILEYSKFDLILICCESQFGFFIGNCIFWEIMFLGY